MRWTAWMVFWGSACCRPGSFGQMPCARTRGAPRCLPSLPWAYLAECEFWGRDERLRGSLHWLTSPDGAGIGSTICGRSQSTGLRRLGMASALWLKRHSQRAGSYWPRMGVSLTPTTPPSRRSMRCACAVPRAGALLPASLSSEQHVSQGRVCRFLSRGPACGHMSLTDCAVHVAANGPS